MTTLEPRPARSPGVSYRELLDADTHPVPAVLRLESPLYLGDTDIPVERYISREWHEIEKERLWSRVWQFACREEQIPDAGDYVVYDITNQSYIVVRQDDGTIKASGGIFVTIIVDKKAKELVISHQYFCDRYVRLTN